MASEYEASCEEDPNFAVICAFFEKFGQLIGITDIDFYELQSMLENSVEVPKFLIDLHIKLLRKIRKFVAPEKWEKGLIKFCYTFSNIDAWELERFGYKNAKLSSKVRTLKELVEAQFDYNLKFKVEINKLSSKDLRSEPLGRDKCGHAYWFQSDDSYQIRVYKEDLDDEKWTLVAKDRGGLVSLITLLSDGDIKMSSDSAGNEDSNSLSEKPIIDTGQQDTDSKKTSDDEDDSNLDKDGDQATKLTPVLRIKNLRELMASPKRPREEEDDTVFQKYKIKNLEVVVADISKSPVVGDAIEDPMIRVEGEGSGADNECPIIVGEIIEEDILYFYGNGNGVDCETGNEPENSNDNAPKSSSTEMKSLGEKQSISEESDGTKDNLEQKTDKGSQSIDKNSDLPSEMCLLENKNGATSLKNKDDASLSEKPESPERNYDTSQNIVETKKDESSTTTEPDSTVLNNDEPKASENKISESKLILDIDQNLENPKSEETAVDKNKKTELDINKSVTDLKDENTSSSANNLSSKKSPLVPVKDPPVVPVKVQPVLPIDVPPVVPVEVPSENTIVVPPKVPVEVPPEVPVEVPPEVPVDVPPEVPVEVPPKVSVEVPPEVSVEVTPVVPIKEPICIKKKAFVCGNKTKSKKHSPAEETTETSEVIETKDSDNTIKGVELTDEKIAAVSTNGNNDVEEDRKEKEAETSPSDDGTSKTDNEIRTETVFVKSKITKKTKPTDEPLRKKGRPKKKAVKGATQRKTRTKTVDSEGDGKSEDKSKVNSAESSVANSPFQSIGDNSAISMGELTAGDSCDVVVEADPLAVSENEEIDPKNTSAADPTISTLSLDFKNSPSPEPEPKPKAVKPSPMRAVRKRGIEVLSVKAQDPDDGPGKRMKLKGRRPVDTALRKSVEQRIEQLHASSSDSKDSEDEPLQSKKSGRFSKKKSPKKVAVKGAKSEKSKDKTFDSKKKISRASLQVEEPSDDIPLLRQSRRIAQLKIKEQADDDKPVHETVYEEDAVKKKKHKKEDKYEKPEKRKRDKKGKEEIVSEPEEKVGRKKKKRKEKPLSQMFNENRPWQSSTEDSDDAPDEEEEEEIIEEEDDPPLAPLKSDHEFSPESADEGDDDWQPLKRARTARKESDVEEVEDFPCQKCSKSDHPEWILLCDKCDNGWHCSCLRPPLLGIPEGKWFCPPCEHIILLERLQDKLVEYDKKLSKKEMEDRRKERLAYVGISLNNVLPNKDHADHNKKKKRRHSSDGSVSSSESESERSESESETDSDEPIYQLRQRRQTKSYKFNDYDDLIKDALGEDTDKPEDTAGNLGRGKDIQTIVKGLEEEPESKEGADGKDKEDRPSTAHLKKMLRKKHRKLNSLDFDSEEEDISDEDFKGSNSESEEEEEVTENSEDSDDYVGRKRRKTLPVRRSTRARTRRYDDDFVNDTSEEEAPRRKKKKSKWNESDTEESDLSGYAQRRKSKKKKKKKNRDGLDNESSTKKPRPRIRYGGLTSSEEEDLGKGRRTRGKKTTYVDTLGSDSEEENISKKNPRRIMSDDEDFVANEEDEGDEEKDSEEKEKEEEEDEVEEEDEDSEQDRRVLKPPLIVPKIYIKKPLGTKRPIAPVQINPPSKQDAQTEDTKKPDESSKEEVKIANVDISSVVKQEKTDPCSEKTGTQITEPPKPAMNTASPPKISKAIPLPAPPIKIPPTQVKKEKEDEESEGVAPELNHQKSQPFASLVPRKPNIIHEPIVSNVAALIKNDIENDDLSEPPGISLPLFDDLNSDSANSKDATPIADSPKKRRGRGPGKKKLAEAANIGNNIPAKSPEPAIEIATPPQPFSQSQPTPSVITRMLQAKPGISIYPVGRIRPKQFATMRDDDSDESSPKNSPPSSPVVSRMGGVPNQYNMPGAPRGAAPMPYRHHGPPHPGMNHYPRGPPSMRAPPPHPYGHHQSHRVMDPSPSGGGPINLTEPPQRPPGPPTVSALPMAGQDNSGRRGAPINRYPPVSQAPLASVMSGQRPPMHMHQQPYRPPPPSNNGPPITPQSYPPPAPSSGGPPSSHPPYPHGPPTSGNSTRISPQAYVPPPVSNNGPQASLQSYPPPAVSGSGPQTAQPQYPPAPTAPTTESGPTPVSSSSDGYYGSYRPPPPIEDAMPPTAFEGIPPESDSSYQEPYEGESQTPGNPPSDSSNSKAYDDESGGEFAGLASYFSSQREDDLES